ncbi:MAG: DUF3857 domain-containing protein [Sphingobacteriales bacterium]|nr:DUF3857 domain-containing protein [Sphingobacteriales bacterium]
MEKKLIISCCCLIMGLTVFAGDGEYAVTKIPAVLLKNANAVKRMEQISFEVVNTGEAILKKRYAITILNENGDQQALFMEYYDKMFEIKNIEGALYDAGGKELKRLKNKQIMDITGSDDNNLIDDNRRKVHDFFHRIYPYTVEYEVEIRFEGTLFFPVWLPREDEDFAVEQSSISIISHPDYTVRYKAFNYPGEPVVTTEKNRKILTWEVKELPAIKDEYASPPWEDINTAVYFGPTAFEVQKYKGNMESWQDFGKFVYALKAGRDKLPDNIKQVVHQLADPVRDPKEKIAKLYEYMQKNTRYISIQLGIGGWQPFDAAYVAGKSYGDCKALTNYMFSLLKEAGINSYYTLVRAGRSAKRIMADFPSSQFNHVILCVPVSSDTVWLECTSQTLPAGYLGDFTCDRHVLIVDENGGKLIRTPKYAMKENLQTRRVKAVLDEEDNLRVKSETVYGGLQQDNYHDLIHGLSKDKVKEVLHEQLDFATYEVNSFEYKETRSVLPEVEEKLDITVNNYATLTGKRLFIVPNVMTRTYHRLTPNEDRKFDIELGFEYKDVDTVEITIPAGYSAESVPAEISLSTKFGNYQSRVKVEGNRITYYRSIEHFSGTYPAKDYADLVKFYDAMYKADRNKLVLVKNETAAKGF